MVNEPEVTLREGEMKRLQFTTTLLDATNSYKLVLN